MTSEKSSKSMAPSKVSVSSKEIPSLMPSSNTKTPRMPIKPSTRTIYLNSVEIVFTLVSAILVLILHKII